MKAVAHDEAWESAALGASEGATGAATSSGGDLIRTDLTLTSPGIAKNDLVIVRIQRDTDHADDTLTGDAELVFLQGEVG